MPDSTLDLSRPAPSATGKGHGTAALGPSDTSDSGSDMQGPGLFESDVNQPLDTTNADSAQGAGRDVGDANLDSDSDAGGTGERASAGRDSEVEAGSDIAPDRLIGSGAPIPADALDRIAVDDSEPADDEDL